MYVDSCHFIKEFLYFSSCLIILVWFISRDLSLDGFLQVSSVELVVILSREVLPFLQLLQIDNFAIYSISELESIIPNNSGFKVYGPTFICDLMFLSCFFQYILLTLEAAQGSRLQNLTPVTYFFHQDYTSYTSPDSDTSPGSLWGTTSFQSLQ